MFIKLHGILGNRLIINVNAIKAFQEIVEGSKYSKYIESGAKTALQVGDDMILVKNTIVQIENMLKKAEQIGGSK